MPSLNILKNKHHIRIQVLVPMVFLYRGSTVCIFEWDIERRRGYFFVGYREEKVIFLRISML